MIRGPPEPEVPSVQTEPEVPSVQTDSNPKGETMKKYLVITGLAVAGLLGTVACTGTASADEQTIVINESSSSSGTSTDCLPAEVLDQLPPWLLLGSVPACP